MAPPLLFFIMEFNRISVNRIELYILSYKIATSISYNRNINA